MDHAAEAFRDLTAIRERKPLVLNVTNYVVANTTANALLALGASPAMSHNPRDLSELAGFAGCLVVNIGTPTEEFLEGMCAAGRVAVEKNVPIVLDPVAAGATTIRTEAAISFLRDYRPAIVRGNASEIMALAGAGGRPKGVDASQGADEAVEAAKDLALRFSCTAVVSGETDYVTDGERVLAVTGGHEMMPLVTGLGCTATALIGAFAAVNESALEASAHGMAVMSAAGHIAASRAQGPGTLQLHFYDALYQLNEAAIRDAVSIKE